MSIETLASSQLHAYNQKDIDLFCACFGQDVRVLDTDGTVLIAGIHDFRAKYQALFADHTEFGAAVEERVTVPPHCVDHEFWWRTHGQSGVSTSGEVLVRYTKVGDTIGVVQFFR